MKILFYNTKSYDKISFREQLSENYPDIEVTFVEAGLNINTVEMAHGYDAICIFVNDKIDANIAAELYHCNCRCVLLRCAGYNNVDIKACTANGIDVYRVPAYSPESIAEHAMTLALCVNRKVHKAYNRLRENNFSLTGLSGFCLSEKTAGIIGYGKIGKRLAKICKGFGMDITVYDPYFNEDPETKVRNVDIDSLYRHSDFIFLTTVLNKSTYHMINKKSISKMKDNVVLINVSRGGLIDTEALIQANKDGKFFGIGLDVYEGEDENVYTNHEDDILMNCITSRLTSFPNVVVTSHQAFLTDVALRQIAKTTLDNMRYYTNNVETANKVKED